MKLRTAAAPLALAFAAAILSLAPPAAEADPITAVNRSPITFPDEGPTPADPFPATIEFAGSSAVVTDVVVRVGNLSHTFPADLDMELVGPSGAAVPLMSDQCGAADMVRATLFFDDEATALLPVDNGDPCSSGIVRPGNFDDDDVWAVTPTATSLSVFDGTDPRGTWRLFVRDDKGQDTGQIASGWALQITTTPVVDPGPGSDVLAPETRMTRTPHSSARRATQVAFTSSEPGSRFECRVDLHRFGPCSSPLRLSHLRPGRHVVEVRAIDSAGNVDPTPARVRWTVRRR